MVLQHGKMVATREPGGLVYFRSFLCESLLSNRLGFTWSEVDRGISFDYLGSEGGPTCDHDIHGGNVIQWPWGFGPFVNAVLAMAQCGTFPIRHEQSKDVFIPIEIPEDIFVGLQLTFGINEDGRRFIIVVIAQKPSRPLEEIAEAIWKWSESAAFSAGSYRVDSNGDILVDSSSVRPRKMSHVIRMAYRGARYAIEVGWRYASKLTTR